MGRRAALTGGAHAATRAAGGGPERLQGAVLSTALLLAAALLVAGSGRAAAQDDGKGEFLPGFGILYGEGRTENDGHTQRFGFTTRRLRDNQRVGSLALIYEENTDGLDFALLDHSLAKQDVELRYQSLFAELKRYFPLGGPFWYYWGIRGGYSRVQGRIRPEGGGPRSEFEATSVAPLGLLALPFMLEEPAFVVLAAVDGTSAGAVLDLVPSKVWLDFQIGATVLPRHRDQQVALEKLFMVTRTAQLVIVF